MKAAARSTASWLPPEGTVWHIAGGVHWDVVRAPLTLGLVAVERLGEDCGAVICDPWARTLYFLVDPCSTAGWQVPRTFAGSTATYVTVPPLDGRDPQLHWQRSPAESRIITRTEQLRTALAGAVAHQLGPRTTGESWLP
ncbi:hypothetical protein N4G70_22305 [Streptomyces sp. ASQP_92]|uniref:hypothetical protein n=1 Tax=Streptomyces sp. ASQP_92 TaxID=2979116 RepID=UPI0021BFF970|nr:hypothetical protein [Streptomyces sp. ASQP_92]MCT9091580.1 hypothetical protein [Streptomyces sp. ASQP_92]